MIAIYQALHIVVSGGPYDSDLPGLTTLLCRVAPMIAIYQALHIVVSGGPYDSDLSGLTQCCVGWPL